MRRGWIYIAMVLAAGFAGGWTARAPGPPGGAVAQVAGVDISVDLFRESYAAYLLKSGLKDDLRARRAHLEHLIARELVIRAMREEGIERDARYGYEKEMLERALLIDAYSESAVFEGVEATEADLREMFVRANTKLKARHLYARTEEHARALHARLRAGERFEDLAREVFADPKLAESGGSVDYFGFDEMDPAFEDAAYALEVGETSAPVRTAFGYSIIQLQDRKHVPVLTEAEFHEKKSQLRRYALRRKRTEALFEHSDVLEKELAIRFRKDALEKLHGQLQGTVLMPTDEAATAWLGAPLVGFTSGGRQQTWTIAEFRARAQYTSQEQRARIGSMEELEAFVKGLVVREEMMRRAGALGLAEDPRYRVALQQAIGDWIYKQAYGRIEAAVSVPEDSLRVMYERTKDVLTTPEKVRVHEILLGTKAEADRVKAQLAAQPFEALARAHSLRPGASGNGGDLGFLSPEQLGLLADAVFEGEPGAVLGPLEVAGHYVLLKVGDREAARPMTYEEALPEVEKMVRAEMVRAAFAAHVAALRDRYGATVDLAALAAVDVPV